HQGFHDAEHAQRVLGKRILRQADQRAHHQPADLTAPHDGEIDHHQQRHLQKTQEREKHGDVDLEQDGHQRHYQEYPLTKPRNLAFALAAEEDPLARVGHRRICPPAGVPADGFKRRAASGGFLAGVPAGGGALLPGGPRGYPPWPPVPVFAGAAGDAAGGPAGGAPGGGGEFFPAPGFGGVPAGEAVFFPAGPRGYAPWPAAPGFASLVKSGGLAPGGFSPYVCFCSSPSAWYCERRRSASVPTGAGTAAPAGLDSLPGGGAAM